MLFLMQILFYHAVQHPKPVARSSASHIKLAFTDGGLANMKACLSKAIAERAWERMPHSKISNLPMRNTPVCLFLQIYYFYIVLMTIF